jgi:hypothetical protein
MIVSLHIAKTRGMTFADLLLKSFPKGEVAVVGFCGNCRKLFYGYEMSGEIIATNESDGCDTHVPVTDFISTSIRNGVMPKYMHGHIDWKQVTRIWETQQPDLEYIFWLRNPLQRYMSHYYHLVKTGKYNNDLTFEEYLRDTRYQNLQSKSIRGISLKRIKFVGISERMESEVLRLSHIFKDKELAWNNANELLTKGEEYRFTYNQTRAVVAVNQEDIALYNAFCILGRHEDLCIDL